MESKYGDASESHLIINDTIKTEIQKRASAKVANQSLKYTAMFWFITTLVGQWFFFYYIMAFYGFSVINDNM
jgi:hypothetical protein